MAITAAVIEANGWVLRVTLAGSLSSAIVPGYSNGYSTPNVGTDVPSQWTTNFSAYALAPSSGAPALTLAMATSGYIQSGGTAVASAVVGRALIATKALRRVVDATAAGLRRPKNPDETDNGDGTITVRIALSQHVYAGDSGLVLTALAGWRTGAAAQAGVAVTNNSTVLAPAPLARWSDVPYQRRTAAFPLEVVVASHHPQGLAPVAGVRFTVTDGTTVKSYWATALTNSAVVPSTDGTGRTVRVYGVTVDPTTATALTQGLLRCDFEVYPWIGPVQKSDPAGTKSMTGLGTAALATAAFVPFVVAWDPAGTWLTPRYAYVNAATGSSTAAAANVSTNAASAAATPLASINLAIESLRLDAVAHTSYGTVAAANGQAAIAQSLDACHVRLAAGVTLGAGTSAVTAGAQTAASWLVIEGDPADANPRADCILRTPTSANGISKVTRVKVTNLSVEAGANSVFGVGAAWLDNFELRGASGQTATTSTPIGASGAVQFVTNGKWWQYGIGPALSGTQQNPVVVRNVSVERTIDAPVVLNCARLPTAIAGTAGIGGATVTSPSSDAGASLERIALGNDLRYLNGNAALIAKALTNAAALAATPAQAGATPVSSLVLGAATPVIARWAWLNNVAEIYGTISALWAGLGENNPSVTTQYIVEGNTFTGDRTNNDYNDLNMATIALNDSATSISQVERYANNVTMKNASKHDAYADGVVAGGQLTTLPYTFGRIGVALGTAKTRNWAVAVGQELVIAGSPANVYHCTTAGTTAASGGPTGTGSAISDGTAVWQWVATETRQHGYRPQAVDGWSSAYGVGYEGNIDFQGPAGPSWDPEFFFEFYGLNSDQLSQEGIDVGSTPFTLDKSGTSNRLAFQPAPDGTGGGNYKPLSTGAGTYILNRAKTANVDVDSRGVARAQSFAAGAIEGTTPVALVPAADRQASSAAASGVGWAATLGAAAATMPMRAATGLAGWVVTIRAASAASASHAAASVTGWSAVLGATSDTLVTRAATSTLGWTTTVTAAASRLASLVATSVTGWTTALAVDSDRSATATAAGVVTWQGELIPDFDRSPMFASASIVTTLGSWLIVIDSGRIAVVDRMLPSVPPAMTTPAERTLVVGGESRAAPLV